MIEITVKMYKILILTMAMVFVVSTLISQEITNVHFEQEGKKIKIYYDLSGDAVYDVKVFCSNDGGKNWGQSLVEVKGDVGREQKQGTNKKIDWDVITEQEKLEGEVAFKIVASKLRYADIEGIYNDSRDGHSYKWIKIGNQIWMQENLNYITESGSRCYDDRVSNCIVYGRLYDLNSAKIACPNGWNLPASSDWNELTSFLGGDSVAGGKMKEIGYQHWGKPNKGASNSSGFSGLPAGIHYDNDKAIGMMTSFWSSTEDSMNTPWIGGLSVNSNRFEGGFFDKKFALSVRCIWDEEQPLIDQKPEVEAQSLLINNDIEIFTDLRDGKIYTSKRIGDQVWMTENLNYNSLSGSWCKFSNSDFSSDCQTYGRLYEWRIAINACPMGWHLPSEEDWSRLISYLGGTGVAGGKLKEEGLNHWSLQNYGANNSSGFTALPGGALIDGEFDQDRLFCLFWTSTEMDTVNAKDIELRFDTNEIFSYEYNKSNGLSVRCIKD